MYPKLAIDANLKSLISNPAKEDCLLAILNFVVVDVISMKCIRNKS